MSGISLDARKLDLLEQALITLSSPFEAGGVDEWRRRANRSVRELVGGDRAIFSFPGSGGAVLHSEEYDHAVLDDYVGHYRAMDVGARRLLENGLEVFCKRQVYADGLSPGESKIYSQYHGEFLSPLDIRDSIGMVAELSPEPAAMVALWVHHERFGTDDAGERGMRIFRLLLPAFRAGVAMWRSLHDRRGRLGALLDDLREPVALLDSDGRELHRNRSLRKLLEESPGSEVLEARIRAAARPLRRTRPGDPAGSGGAPHQRFLVGGVPYELYAVSVNRPLALDRDVVLVSVRRRQRPPERKLLQEAFALTPREAEVAQHLWSRRTNREIAEALVVSPHTARRHTERVREKLGITSRLDVRKAVERFLDEG